MKPSLATLLVALILAIPAMAQFVQPLVIGGAQPHIVSTKIQQVSFCNNNTCSFAPGTSNAIGQGVVTLSNGGMFSGTWTMPTTGTATNPPGASCTDNSAFFTISSAGLLASTAQSATQTYMVCVAASQPGLGPPNPYIQVVTLSPGSGVCGGESPPQQAVNAGLTTCVANFDFTQSTGVSWLPSAFAFSGPVATTSNWLDCTGSDSGKLWHFGTFGGSPTGTSCSNITTATDTACNCQVLDEHYLSSYTTSYFGMENGTLGYADTAAFNFPITYFVEVVARMTYKGGGGTGTVDTFTLPGQSPSSNLGQQMYEFNTDGSSEIDWGASIGSWPSNTLTFACSWNCSGFFGSTATPSPWTVPGWVDSTVYAKYQSLNTTDGSTEDDICAWAVTTFLGCVNATNQMSGFNQRMAFVVSAGASGVGTYDHYVQYIRVWSCANWATQPCYGSTKAGGPPPSLTYWH